MATKTKNIVEAYDRIPMASTPSNEPYGVKLGTEEDAKRRILARDTFIQSPSLSEPILDYPLLESSDIDLVSQSEILQRLMEDIDDLPDDISEEEKDLLFEIIHKKRDEILRQLVVLRRVGKKSLATWHGDISENQLDVLAAKKSIEIFGSPDPRVFNFFLSQACERAKSLIDSSSDLNIKKIASEFISFFPDTHSDGGEEPYELDKEYLEELKQDLFVIFPGLEKMISQEVSYPISPEESLKYVNQALAVVGLSDLGFSGRLTNGSALEENYSDRTVDVGRSRRDFTGEAGNDVIATSLHEAIHLLREYNAHQQGPRYRLATRGNVAAEEGFCVGIEQIIRGENQTRGLQYYLAIGLQMGLDSHPEHPTYNARNFRETFEAMWRMEVLNKIVESKDVIRQKRQSYATVLRTRRGGSLDTRDIQYYASDQNIKKWLLSLRGLNPEERQRKIRWALSAQFDPNDEMESEYFSDILVFEGHNYEGS